MEISYLIHYKKSNSFSEKNKKKGKMAQNPLFYAGYAILDTS